ncbi:hypothetical protein SLEP1_g13081 [Rubroshorea leprosula]|uniref:Uncharacterized protein n=1 Tax=Rubroshorea leprosula TaxID=152421 RepID=A0AAV5IQ10_9ROSI|nr:hypothetical protein SLEP1_g13081 [Rubroshorea leprosula]
MSMRILFNLESWKLAFSKLLQKENICMGLHPLKIIFSWDVCSLKNLKVRIGFWRCSRSLQSIASNTKSFISKSIGYITTGVPFSVQRLVTETFVTVSVGKAFQIYNCAKHKLVLMGPQLPNKIRALASHRDYAFVAYGTHIAVATCQGQFSAFVWTAQSV